MPVLSVIYKLLRIKPISDDPVEIVILSENEPLPINSEPKPEQHSAIVHNRFSRMDGVGVAMEHAHSLHSEDAEAILRCSEEGWPLPESRDSDSMRKRDVFEVHIKNVV